VRRFLAAGSDVIVTGRRQAALAAIKAKHPRAVTRALDVADAAQRVALRDWVVAEHPDTNVVINNAGVQRFIPDLGAAEPWEATAVELETNLAALIHLSRLFLPHLRAARGGTLVNVTSGLSFVPKVGARELWRRPAVADASAAVERPHSPPCDPRPPRPSYPYQIDVPVYCATKAAAHSFTVSLRAQEQARAPSAGARVIEVVPPAVNTDLGGPGLHDFGAPLDEFADSVMKARGASGPRRGVLRASDVFLGHPTAPPDGRPRSPRPAQDLAVGKETVYFGFSGKLATAAGEEWDKAFAAVNALGKK
jgi:uncharacterized oxidoreductase